MLGGETKEGGASVVDEDGPVMQVLKKETSFQWIAIFLYRTACVHALIINEIIALEKHMHK